MPREAQERRPDTQREAPPMAGDHTHTSELAASGESCCQSEESLVKCVRAGVGEQAHSACSHVKLALPSRGARRCLSDPAGKISGTCHSLSSGAVVKIAAGRAKAGGGHMRKGLLSRPTPVRF